MGFHPEVILFEFLAFSQDGSLEVGFAGWGHNLYLEQRDNFFNRRMAGRGRNAKCSYASYCNETDKCDFTLNVTFRGVNVMKYDFPRDGLIFELWKNQVFVRKTW